MFLKTDFHSRISWAQEPSVEGRAQGQALPPLLSTQDLLGSGTTISPISPLTSPFQTPSLSTDLPLCLPEQPDFFPPPSLTMLSSPEVYPYFPYIQCGRNSHCVTNSSFRVPDTWAFPSEHLRLQPALTRYMAERPWNGHCRFSA